MAASSFHSIPLAFAAVSRAALSALARSRACILNIAAVAALDPAVFIAEVNPCLQAALSALNRCRYDGGAAFSVNGISNRSLPLAVTWAFQSPISRSGSADVKRL